MIQAGIKAQNEQVVIANLRTLDERILTAAETGLARGLLLVVAKSQREYLSGPRPARLQSVTGRLRQGVTSSVSRQGDKIVGRVGNAVKYAAFHEFGFHGVMNVRAHTRVTDQVSGNLDLETDTRRAIRDRDGNLLGYKESRKASTKFQRGGFVSVQFVKAHQRKVNYAGKPYLRPALEALLPQIGAEIAKDLKAVNDGNKALRDIREEAEGED
jgi:hypothetical protein